MVQEEGCEDTGSGTGKGKTAEHILQRKDARNMDKDNIMNRNPCCIFLEPPRQFIYIAFTSHNFK